jgi:asparagine synthase (glutamine-hydrolysing)
MVGPELAGAIREAHETFAREYQGHKLSFILFKQAPWFIHARLSLERSQVSMRTPYFDNDLVALAYQAPAEMAESSELGLRLIARGAPSLESVATDRGQGLKAIPGVHALSRAFGEFTFKAEYAYDSGMPQWLARVDKTLRPLRLEKLFLGRHKISHFRIWYRDELSDYVKATLLDSKTLGRPHLRGDVVKRMVEHHVQGVGNHTLEIQRLLTLEVAQRQLME